MDWFENKANIIDQQAEECSQDAQVIINAILLLAEVLYEQTKALTPGNRQSVVD